MISLLPYYFPKLHRTILQEIQIFKVVSSFKEKLTDISGFITRYINVQQINIVIDIFY